jgi:hypothetical protein
VPIFMMVFVISCVICMYLFIYRAVTLFFYKNVPCNNWRTYNSLAQCFGTGACLLTTYTVVLGKLKWILFFLYLDILLHFYNRYDFGVRLSYVSILSFNLLYIMLEWDPVIINKTSILWVSQLIISCGCTIKRLKYMVTVS